MLRLKPQCRHKRLMSWTSKKPNWNKSNQTGYHKRFHFKLIYFAHIYKQRSVCIKEAKIRLCPHRSTCSVCFRHKQMIEHWYFDFKFIYIATPGIVNLFKYCKHIFESSGGLVIGVWGRGGGRSGFFPLFCWTPASWTSLVFDKIKRLRYPLFVQAVNQTLAFQCIKMFNLCSIMINPSLATITLTLWWCFNKDDGRGPKQGRNFQLLSPPTPGSSPGPSACQANPTLAKPRQLKCINSMKTFSKIPANIANVSKSDSWSPLNTNMCLVFGQDLVNGSLMSITCYAKMLSLKINCVL